MRKTCDFAGARRAVSEVAVLWQPQDGRQGGPPSGPAADAHLGYRSSLPKTASDRPVAGHQIYPYLLRGVAIERPNQVWSTDITYLPMRGGFLYLVAVMDWYSRYVLSWNSPTPWRQASAWPCAGRSVPLRPARNLELRSRLAVHRSRFPGPLKQRHLDQHGWSRPRARQRVHRASVALAQVRTDLPRRLPKRPGSVPGARELLSLLVQLAAATTRRSAIRRRPICSRTDPKEKGIAMMGDPNLQTPGI